MAGCEIVIIIICIGKSQGKGKYRRLVWSSLINRQMLAGVELRIEHKNSRSILLRITFLQNRYVYTASRTSSIVYLFNVNVIVDVESLIF